MNIKYTGLYAAMFSAMIGLAGCSSSSNNTSSDANVTGRITGFGSVYVDGVEYETNGTNIVIDGVPATENDLAVGMLVTLHGSDDGVNGDATSISFNDNLEGVVTSNDSSGLVVMGYTITTDNQTNIEGLTDVNNDGTIDILDLAVGDEVEISGYPDGNGGIQATYIELEGTYVDGDEIEVKGLISALDEAAQQFNIGNMVVDYSAANLDEAGTLANDVYVEVKAESAPDATTGILTATKVELEEHSVDGEHGDELEVEGLITAIDLDAGTITIGDQTFTLPAGFDLGDYTVGDMVELEIDVVGTELIVSEIEDEGNDDDHPGKIEIKAIPTATDTVNNTITIAGITISVNPNVTIMLDHDTDAETTDHYFNLGSISVNSDRVEVEAIPNADGGYTAITIERLTGSSTTVELEGPVAIDSTSGVMTIAGITLDITTNSVTIPAGVVDNAEIHANGTLNANNVLIVTVIELD